MLMVRPVISLINVNVSRSHSLGYPWRAFQRKSLFDQHRAMQSYLSERFMNISSLRKNIPW